MVRAALFILFMATALCHVTSSCDLEPQWAYLSNGTISATYYEEFSNFSTSMMPCFTICFLRSPAECGAGTLTCYEGHCKCTILTGYQSYSFAESTIDEPSTMFFRATLLGSDINLSSTLTFPLEGLSIDHQKVRLLFTLPSVKTTIQFIKSNADIVFYAEIWMGAGFWNFNSILGGVTGSSKTELPTFFVYEAGRLVDVIIERDVDGFKTWADYQKVTGLVHRDWDFADINTLKVIPEGSAGYVYKVMTT